MGASFLGNGLSLFVVWAPLAPKVDVHLLAPCERLVPMESEERGYHHAAVDGVEPGSLYLYRLDERRERPDPASRFQPRGVHGPSEVVSPHFEWDDAGWTGLPLQEYTIYELHVGTFTPEGTFDAVIPQLGELKELGITAIELMPVAQFPGSRNWGYDGVCPFAVQNSYGGPTGLKRLVNACHKLGLAVVLDVVYNHLGPEGNYAAEFGPYFTDKYMTPWGAALNFDGPHSDEVRRFFVENALYWVTEFHIDALRLDAVHAIVDHSAVPFVEELAEAVHHRAEDLSRRIYVIAESNLNDARLVRPREMGGQGLDAQWNEDFHHSLRTLLTGERAGYYQDFGELGQLVKAFSDGFVYSGQYSPYYGRRHGNSSRDVPAHKLLVFSRNHDQVGNRMLGERLSQLVPFEGLKLAAGVILLSPFIPLLFMGEEYGETAPFQYFISHSDAQLVEAVRQGRREEFEAFEWKGDLPDPQDEATFLRSKLNRSLRSEGNHRVLLEFYKELLQLRRTITALADLSKEQMEVAGYEKEQVLFLRRWSGSSEVFAVFNFGDAEAAVAVRVPEGRWRKLLDSADERWQGEESSLPDMLRLEGEGTLALSPLSFAVFTKENEP
ncbi:MAG: malto-oligosyltrehalose trehalohydrolase [Dehalococcoidia bacterium SM23_28_2]|nr:MAG: malto-oligosyltrehalose trehalohydrolase [Dehalococcoidia bacterium SM23_28_2]